MNSFFANVAGSVRNSLKLGMFSSAELPLFPLGTVLFPGGTMALKVFEQRYLEMAKSCLRTQAPFGVALITLIIFDQKKKYQKFDLAVIGIIQLSALAYGASIMFQARPVFVVYYKDRFEVVIPARIPSDELARVTRGTFKTIPLDGPMHVAVSLPSDEKELQRMLTESRAFGDYFAFPQHYVSYADRAAVAGVASKSIKTLRTKNPKIDDQLIPLLNARGIDEDKVGFLPLNTKSDDMAVILEKTTGRILGMIFCDPW